MRLRPRPSVLVFVFFRLPPAGEIPRSGDHCRTANGMLEIFFYFHFNYSAIRPRPSLSLLFFRLVSAGEIPGPGNPLPHHERFVRGVLFYLHVYFNAMRPLPSLPLLYSVCHPQAKFRQNFQNLIFQLQVMKMGEGEPTGKRFLDRLYFRIHCVSYTFFIVFVFEIAGEVPWSPQMVCLRCFILFSILFQCNTPLALTSPYLLLIAIDRRSANGLFESFILFSL